MIERFTAMGCEIVVGGAADHELASVIRLFEERDGRFSRFRGDSELTHVNRSTEETLVVSTDFARLLRAGLRAAARTDGLVDPTVGGAIAALGYTDDFVRLRPDPRPVQPVPAGRWRSVTVGNRLVHRPQGVVLDLNGVVKSLTVDDAVRMLSGGGFVSAGGDLAVTRPTVVGLPGGGAITVFSGGLATSGTARRWRRGDRELHHLVDPGTGLPAASPWHEVTVAAATCLDADVAAKAAFLSGAGGPAWLDERGLAGRFVGEIVVESASWRDALARESAWA